MSATVGGHGAEVADSLRLSRKPNLPALFATGTSPNMNLVAASTVNDGSETADQGLQRKGKALKSVQAARFWKTGKVDTSYSQQKLNTHRAPLAQLAEQLTLNQRVVGSSPTRGT